MLIYKLCFYAAINVSKSILHDLYNLYKIVKFVNVKKKEKKIKSLNTMYNVMYINCTMCMYM